MTIVRIPFTGFSPRNLQMAGDPNLLHQEVTAFFGSSRAAAAALFRIDEVSAGFDLLILCPERPSFERLPWRVCDLRCAPESKPFVPNLRAGDRLAFRLLARPGKRLATGEDKGKRRDLRTDEERLAWLHRKALASGFTVVSCGLTLLTFGPVKSERLPSRRRFRVEGHWETERGSSFQAVRFDGELVVDDPALLMEAIKKGFGPGKAFGFGLLSIGKPT